MQIIQLQLLSELHESTLSLITHSARRPWKLSERSTLGPYESFPHVLIRPYSSRTQERPRVDVVSKSDVRITFLGRRDVKRRPENFHTSPMQVVLSTSSPIATYYGPHLPNWYVPCWEWEPSTMLYVIQRFNKNQDFCPQKQNSTPYAVLISRLTYNHVDVCVSYILRLNIKRKKKRKLIILINIIG